MNATDSNHSWCDSTVFTEEEDRTEIIRRVSLVKHHLISDLLASGGHTLSTSGILNHITILLQLPVILLIYKESEDARKAEWLQHFDFKKTRASRGGLIFKDLQNRPINQRDPILLENGEQNHLFEIFGTRKFLRVFLLEDPINSMDEFIEVLANQHGDIGIENDTQDRRNKREYSRICLNGLLAFDVEDEKNYGLEFLSIIQQKVIDIIVAQKYEKPPPERRARTLLPVLKISNTKLEPDRSVEQYLREASSKGSGLNRIYNRSKFASRAIKSIWRTQGGALSEDASKSAPNVIFTLRSYNRHVARCARQIFGEEPFHGYAHNVSFVVPLSQLEHIEEYFRALQKCGAKFYRDEQYGASDWKAIDEPYKNFAASLNTEFWRVLGRGAIGISILSKILTSRIGSSATSLVDSVFYYGSALYRMPFRRQGGLDRIYGLKEIYDALPESERKTFNIKHITEKYINSLGLSWSKEKIREIHIDCLRVVVFFYLTRMLGPNINKKHEYWTKILLFPIDVSGAVVGTLGCVSFEKKEPDVRQRMPSERAIWNQELYFFSEIFASSQQFLRQQYRNFQIKCLSDALKLSLQRLIERTLADEDECTPPEAFAELVDSLNSEAEAISRVCPYPRPLFQLGLEEKVIKIDSSDPNGARKYLEKLALKTWSEDADMASDAEEKYVTIGSNIRLYIKPCEDLEIFRAHQGLPGLGDVHQENIQMLMAKFAAAIKEVLEHAAAIK